MTPKEKAPKVVSDLAPRYLKLEDVATYLSVSVPQVYALVRSGELPRSRSGAAVSGGSTKAN